ncbi:hypothetical protein B0H14DRAFT_2608824 [Mycena olivaceomarginata]|nr:hypothetical protein B0H14DRAFT_2608824 [Mycena olivaceomarginata]
MPQTHNRRSSPLPTKPPFRCTGDEVGRSAQLPPMPLVPVAIPKKSTLVFVWAFDLEGHYEIKLPRDDDYLCLHDHKEVLESVFLHPQMPIEWYNAKQSEWVELPWE